MGPRCLPGLRFTCRPLGVVEDLLGLSTPTRVRVPESPRGPDPALVVIDESVIVELGGRDQGPGPRRQGRQREDGGDGDEGVRRLGGPLHVPATDGRPPTVQPVVRRAGGAPVGGLDPGARRQAPTPGSAARVGEGRPVPEVRPPRVRDGRRRPDASGGDAAVGRHPERAVEEVGLGVPLGEGVHRPVDDGGAGEVKVSAATAEAVGVVGRS